MSLVLPRWTAVVAGLILCFGCGGGPPQFIPPPPGLDETVVVPPELEPEYSALVAAQAPAVLPDNLALQTSSQRRSLGLYIYSTREFLNRGELHLLSLMDDHDQAVASIHEFSDAVGVRPDFKVVETGMGGSDGWHFTLYFDELKTRRELAWYADWIMQNYGQHFLIAWPGPLNTPG